MSSVTRRHRRRWPLLSLIGLSLAGSLGRGSSAAQQPRGPSTFQEVLDVHLVNVDVVVVDKKGALVTDLTLDDFQITDDGKKVEVEYFARLGEGAAPGDAPAAAPGADPAVRPAAGAAVASAASSEPQRLVILVDIDSEKLLNRNRVLDDVARYLEAHPTEVTAMVATYGGTGLQIELPFSTTPAEWRSTIDQIKEMPSRGIARAAEQRRMVESIKAIQRRADHRGSLQGARHQLDELIGTVRSESESMRMDARSTLIAMRTLVSALSTVQGPKSLLYVGDGLPVHPGEELYNLLADVFEDDRRFTGQGSAVAGSASGPTGGSAPGGTQGGIGELQATVAPMAQSTQTLRTDALGLDLTPEIRALTATANSHRVTIYGVSSDVPGGAAQADMNLGARVAPTAALTYDVSRSQTREQSLRLMAGETGGLSLSPNAGIEPFLDRMLADQKNRYSLAYLSPHGGDSEFHRIKVKVNRKGVELRHREGYIDRPREIRVDDLVAAALLLGWMENPHRLEMEVASQMPAENDEVTVTLGIQIPIEELHLVPAGENQEAKLDLYVLSKDAKGALGPMRSVSFTVTLSPSQLAQARGKFYGAHLPVPLTRGAHTVAVGILEPAAQRTSVVRTDVEVGGAGGD
jgi:VWFA-related protein